jgi:hypothetical protein
MVCSPEAEKPSDARPATMIRISRRTKTRIILLGLITKNPVRVGCNWDFKIKEMWIGIKTAEARVLN